MLSRGGVYRGRGGFSVLDLICFPPSPQNNVHGFVNLNPAPCESHRIGIQVDKPFWGEQASGVCAAHPSVRRRLHVSHLFGSRNVDNPRVLQAPSKAILSHCPPHSHGSPGPGNSKEAVDERFQQGLHDALILDDVRDLDFLSENQEKL